MSYECVCMNFCVYYLVVVREEASVYVFFYVI